MRILILSLCLGCTHSLLFAQKAPLKFGEVTRDELEMTSFPNDSTAPAVVLADYGQSAMINRQNVGFTLDFERITKRAITLIPVSSYICAY